MKRALIVFLTVGVVLAVGYVVFSRRQAAQAERQALWEKAKAERAAELERLKNPGRSTLAPLVLPVPLPEDKPARTPQTNAASNDSTNQPAKTNLANQEAIAEIIANLPPRGKKNWQDPVARAALSLVGVDPEAEAIWLDAINNPDLPASERKDLIEDLNEEGFADPKNLTLDDLPLILNRLIWIEEQAPNAMDEVNAAAFMEAYKDLVNMFGRLVQQQGSAASGQP